jgi:transposase
MRLFRKSQERIAREAAAQAEIDRLRKLSAEALALLVLEGLGPEGVAPGRHLRPQELCEYLLRDFPGIGQTKPLELMARVRRALDTLETAGLVSSMSFARSPIWLITSLGTRVLADGTAERHLVKPA